MRFLGFTQPVQRRMRQETSGDDPAVNFDTDWRVFSLCCRFGGHDPAAWHAEVAPATSFDEWGIGHWEGGSEGTVERHYPPLATADTIGQIEALPQPIIESGVISLRWSVFTPRVIRCSATPGASTSGLGGYVAWSDS